MTFLKRPPIVFVAALGISAAASTVALASTSFGSDALAPLSGSPIVIVTNTTPDLDLTFTLDPSVETYPPGTDASICDVTGTAPCVQFSGTLTDNDTDGSYLSINSISLILNAGDDAYFTLDETLFFDDVPAILEGDTNDNFFSNVYTGPIFGVDIAPSTPVGVYDETAEISAAGGDNDPDYNGFTVDATFTIVVTPEPRSGLLILAGLLVLVALDRARRLRMAPRMSGRSST